MTDGKDLTLLKPSSADPPADRSRRIRLIATGALLSLLLTILLGGVFVTSAEETTLGDEEPVLGAEYDEGQRFTCVDTNGDGFISGEEFDAFITLRQERVEERLMGRFDEVDTDDDGKISRPELDARLEGRDDRIVTRVNDRFDEIDTDGDGFVTREEFSTYIRDRFAERRAHMEERFDEIDTDDDGKLSKDELRENIRERRAMRRRFLRFLRRNRE